MQGFSFFLGGGGGGGEMFKWRMEHDPLLWPFVTCSFPKLMRVTSQKNVYWDLKITILGLFFLKAQLAPL